MQRIVWATIATSGPMGQQRYEHEIQRAVEKAAGPEWDFNRITVTSARSDVPATRRVPARANQHAPYPVSRLLGRALYGSPQLVHRLDLRLPAAWGAEVVTVHDLPPLRFDDEGVMTRSALEGARRARRVIVPSTFAGDELRELAAVRSVDVIPYGVSDDYRLSAQATDEQLKDVGIEGPFVLHAAGASQRKNLIGLADAWKQLSSSHPDLQLVLCGPPDVRRDEVFAGLSRVVKTGRLESPVVAALMRRAEAVVVPSTYEGFGLPALEGLVCGTPVVAAARGALPEVCGDAALLVEPDGEALAHGIERVLTDTALAAALRAAGPLRSQVFDWETAARDHMRVYAEAMAA